MNNSKYRKVKDLLHLIKCNSAEQQMMFKSKNGCYYYINVCTRQERSRRADLLTLAFTVELITFEQWKYLYDKYVNTYLDKWTEKCSSYIKRAIR